MPSRVPFARAIVAMALLAVRNVASRRPVVDPDQPDGVVVSITTYGRRTASVHLALESIGRGRVRPARLILWLDDAEVVAEPPRALRRLVVRGLEIRSTDDYGPHKKYYPYVCSKTRHEAPLVTADDDWMVPRRWLATLLAAHDATPGATIAHRVHRMSLLDGEIVPYVDWRPADGPAVSRRHFGTGCFGQLLIPRHLDALRDAGTAFRESAPRADDVWIHHVGVEAGIGVRSAAALRTSAFLPIRGVGRGRTTPLAEANVGDGGNDRQLDATWSRSGLSALLSKTESTRP